MNNLISYLAVGFAFSCILCSGSCPMSNITDQQLLKDNRALRQLYYQFGVKPGSKINIDGLRNLLTKLYIITTCSSGGRSRGYSSRPYSRFSPPHDDYRRDYDSMRQQYPYYNDMSSGGSYRDYNSRYRNYDNRFINKGNSQYLHPDRDSHYPTHDSDAHFNGGSSEPRPDSSTDYKAAAAASVTSEKKKDEEKPQGDEPYRPGSGYRKQDYNSNRPRDLHRPKGDYEQRFEYQGGNYRRASYPKGHTYMDEDCETIESVILKTGLVKEDIPLGPHDLLHLSPAIVRAVLNPPCEPDRRYNLRDMIARNTVHGYNERSHNHHHRHYESYEYNRYHMTRDSWIGAILSLILIGIIACLCILIIPVLKRSKYYLAINHFLLSLAVGALAGDALIHLLPHAFTMEISIDMNGHLVHALYGFTTFIGIILFLMMEKLHNLFGHNISRSRVPTASPEDPEMVKEIGVISSSEMTERNPKRAATIGKKLSQHSTQHSKTSSFTQVDSNPRGCFDSCPPNNVIPAVIEDTNGNSGMDSMRKPRLPERISSTLERERLVAVNQEMLEKVSSTKGIKPNTIPPPPLIQNASPKPSLIRQDSKNFNMILQEYHIGHHGHSHHGHSHVTGKKDTIRTMILLGDGIHTFIDGMAIGAAFGTSLTTGIATAIAVLFHELPHKVGDFSILFDMGMKRNQALKMVLILWLLSFCGLAVGVSLGSITIISPWIYCFTAGIFLYLALVDLLSELTINSDSNCSAVGQIVLQLGGLILGALIMLIIAIYEQNLEYLLEGSFETRDLRDRRYYNRAYNYKFDYNRP